MKKKNLLCLLSLSLLVTGCGDNSNSNETAVTYKRGNDEAIYDVVFGEFSELANAAKEIADDDERFAVYAESEAALLDSAAFVPTTTQGGQYAISRVAPRTVPYVNWGNDSDRLGYAVVANEFIKKEDREAMLELWKQAAAGTGTYDAAAYLKEHGYTLNTGTYGTTFNTKCVTLDPLNTSEAADSEYLVNCFEGLLQYDNITQLNPSGATGYTVSDDGLTYTFTLREDGKWFTNSGEVYASVVADDYVAGFQHMLDAAAGLEYLVEGVVAGVEEYLVGDITDFSQVGIKAEGTDKVVFTLTKPESYFVTRLAYACFLPMNRAFFKSRGGKFGREEFAAASATEAYTYGKIENLDSMLYNGAYYPTVLSDTECTVTKNANFHDAESINMSKIKFIYEDASDANRYYTAVVAGTYVGTSLSESFGTLELAKKDGNFEQYSYVSDTNATTFMGAINVNRGTYALSNNGCASSKTESQKIATGVALRNQNFRKALLHAWDRKGWNAVTTGETLATNNLRNMYTIPNFVMLSKPVTDRYGYTFAKGTSYGEMVQHYCDLRGMHVTVDDGQDGWYDVDVAKDYLAKAKAELGQAFDGPITIDVVYYGASNTQTAQAQQFKTSIENALGAENVVVNVVSASTTDDYYACGYRVNTGDAVNQDFFYGSGWGPDYGDPSSYLDTFLGDYAGYMTKICGLF